MDFTTSKFQEFAIRNFEILDSSNDEAKRLIISKTINLDNLVITTKQQTKGKGRQGREWISEEGNLFSSFIFDISKENHPEFYSYFCALAICKILKTSGLSPQIKWPNDVLVENAKIAGILLEKHNNFLICGIGINIDSSPDHLIERKTTSFKNLKIDFQIEEALRMLTANLSKIIKEYKKSGLANIINDIKTLLVTGNAEILLGDIKTKGEIIGINENGEMLFKTGNEIKKISSGEIFFI